MTPQALKHSILQLALQGRLVEQRPEEGTAKELYRQIRAEKRRLIREGKLKKEKPLQEITEEETPFEIPEGWIWARFGEMSQFLDGKKMQGASHPYLDAKYLRGKSDAAFVTSGKFVSTGTRVILVDGENSGEVFYVPEDGYMGSTFKVLYNSSSMFEPYVLYFLFYHRRDYRNNKKGSAIPHLNKSLFFNMPVPIPPLAEQQRICAKIEELLPYIGRYEQAWNRMEDFHQKFPADMRKSLLQWAIQGKLTEQRPEEGTAEELYQQIQEEKQRLIQERKLKKERPLPEVTEEEKPFEIPESWIWCRLGTVLHKLTDGTHATPKYTARGVPFLSVKDMSSGKLNYSNCKYISEQDHQELSARCNPEYGDLLLTKIGTTGIPVIVDTNQPFSLFVSVALLKFNQDLILNKYLQILINSPLVQVQAAKNTRGVGNKNWVMRDIANTVIVLPPLAEQKRIVSKLEELLPLCGQLK